ncbi:MAG TPA: carbonic anhydrase, partial [Arenimonas sp.]|nr:carbonic anhydrase [Arenimonas sp.]
AWSRGQQVSVHGWVYSLLDGRVRELGMDIDHAEQLDAAYADAVGRLCQKTSHE